jgi:thiol-disulfide isomerase/thioredoxin
MKPRGVIGKGKMAIEKNFPLSRAIPGSRPETPRDAAPECPNVPERLRRRTLAGRAAGAVKVLCLLSSALAAAGCMMLSGTAEPSGTPAPTATGTPELSPQITDTPSATGTEAPTDTPTPTFTLSPTRLPYTMVELEDTGEEFAVLVRQEARNAESVGQTPYIQAYADWCPACRALKRSMKDERMIAAYSGTYILLVNIDIWLDQLPKIGIYLTGVPSIYELDYEGRPTGRFITGAAWEENTPENMAPPLDDFFHPK